MASSARLDELKKKFDENPRRYFAPLANEHRKSGDLDQAIALCRTHLPLQPGHISGHIVLAQALFEAGSLDESREIFHTALGLDPENLIALRYLGDIAKQAADIDTARQWYQRVLEVDPRNDEIVQLVRDLDAPPAAEPAVSSLDRPVTAAPSAAAASYAPPPPPPRAHVEDDARFAPLSLDELDVDDHTATAPNEFAVGTPEIDPFDLDPAGSVDALLDAAPAPSESEDFFLTELTGSNAPTDGSESHATASVTPDAAPSYASATPEAPPSTPDVDADFEEGSFYLEPPPPEPASATAELDVDAPVAHAEPTDVAAEREQVSMPGLDAFAAEYSVPEADLHATAAASEWMAPAREPAPNADALALFAEQQTAEWQPPASEPTLPSAHATDDGLGLEVMEFVPPSRESSPSVSSHTPTTEADPLIGRTLDSVSADESTPAAFVTETMAELYLQQGFRNEALGVYRELLARNPADANLRDRVEQIESGSLSSIGMAAVSENVVESARKRQTARPARSVRSFFASLAGRRVAAHRETTDPRSADIVGEPDQSAPEISYDAVPDAPADAPTQPAFDGVETAEPERATPNVSAAETLAEFDPFADAYESIPAPVDARTGAPNAAASGPSAEPIDQLEATDLSAWAAPSVEMPVAQAEPAAPASDTDAGHRSLEDLFPETPVTERTEAAAQTFATAFGRGEPQGRPTRAASNELSLDNVFRGAPEGAPPAEGGFSFDQFFSDSRSSGDATAAAATTPDAGRDNGSGDAHDIEQFTAWLEGLKKK